jgi:hypothetical protein
MISANGAGPGTSELMVVVRVDDEINQSLTGRRASHGSVRAATAPRRPAPINDMTDANVNGASVLKPERERLSAVIAKTDEKVFRDEEFIEHLERVSETDDDLGDYEPE